MVVTSEAHVRHSALAVEHKCVKKPTPNDCKYCKDSLHEFILLEQLTAWYNQH